MVESDHTLSLRPGGLAARGEFGATESASAGAATTGTIHHSTLEETVARMSRATVNLPVGQSVAGFDWLIGKGPATESQREPVTLSPAVQTEGKELAAGMPSSRHCPARLTPSVSRPFRKRTKG